MLQLLIESHGDALGKAILFILFLFWGVPIILGITALVLRKKKPKTAKVLGIITAVYLIISLGYCSIISL